MANGIIQLDVGWHLDEGHHLDQPPNVPPGPGIVPVRGRRNLKPGSKTMDYIPKKRADLKAWWQNLSDKIVVEGPKMGLAPVDATAAKGLADDVLDLLNGTDDAQAALDAARSQEKNGVPPLEQQVRALVRNWKSLPGYPASGSEGELKLKGPTSTFDPATHDLKPKVTKIRVDFTKGGFDGVAVYGRLRGALGWNRLGTDTFSPYYDTAPLAAPATPETREYALRGIVNDEEVGPQTDIVSIVFGG